ncbi:hypothetical protein [Blastococcus sp. SYSU DS0619]
MSAAGDHSDHGGENDPEFRAGRRKPARRRIVALAAGVIVIIFAVLLSVWLLGRSAADAHGTAGVGSAVQHGAAAESVADGAARTAAL